MCIYVYIYMYVYARSQLQKDVYAAGRAGEERANGFWCARAARGTASLALGYQSRGGLNDQLE